MCTGSEWQNQLSGAAVSVGEVMHNITILILFDFLHFEQKNRSRNIDEMLPGEGNTISK